MLFKIGAHFRATFSAKKLRAADLGTIPPADGGFPDHVHFQQVSSCSVQSALMFDLKQPSD